MNYKDKYLKYKLKYLKLKEQLGGQTNSCIESLDFRIEELNDEYEAASVDKKIKILEVKNNYLKIKEINDTLINLIKTNDGLTTVLEMNKVVEIIKSYLGSADKVDILKKYTELMSYIKKESASLHTGLKMEEYIFTNKNLTSLLIFLKIIDDYSQIYESYFLGDSAAKFKNMMEVLRPGNKYNSIIFSGNMYDKSTGTVKEDYKKLMEEHIDEYYANNKVMVDKIFEHLSGTNRKRMIIYDYVDTGASIPTFVYFLKLLNTKFFKLLGIDTKIKTNILFLSFVGNWVQGKDFRSIAVRMGEPNTKINYILLNINLDSELWEHAVNSDSDRSKICARCIPYYKPDLWKTTPDVYIDDLNGPNYLGCNLNRMYIYLYLCYAFSSTNPNIDLLEYTPIPKSQYFIFGDRFAFLPIMRTNINRSNEKNLLLDVKIKSL